MLERQVVVIPAKPVLTDSRKRKKKLRVAAYCRVSTEEEEQQNSFEVQVAYFTDKINHHDGWELVGVFADEGISGLRTKKRDQFNKMIDLCKKGKVDLILTKSISRFARNTVDCIKHVRTLKSWGIPVIFEKENIDTSDMTSEMILTVLSAFAQAESESTSGNVTRGIRMGYKQGRFAFRYNGFAYRKGEDGQPEIIPKDADAILMIGRDFLNGSSLKVIADKMTGLGIPTPSGKSEWSTQTVLRILQNERYAGDALLQKTFTVDFMERKVIKNHGELPQYYIKNSHPAIYPREMYNQIQEELARRRSKKPANTKKSKTNRGRFTSKYALSERLVCGDCGSYYRRVTWNIHGRRQVVWRCINRLEWGPTVCGKSPSLNEESLHRAIMEAIRSLVEGRREEIASSLQKTLVDCVAGETNDTDPVALKNKIGELEKEFDRLLTLAVNENEVIELKLKKTNDEILRLRQQIKQIEMSGDYRKSQEVKTKEVIELISSDELDLTEFSEPLVRRIIERITVLSKEAIKIHFIGGLEIVQPMH